MGAFYNWLSSWSQPAWSGFKPFQWGNSPASDPWGWEAGRATSALRSELSYGPRRAEELGSWNYRYRGEAGESAKKRLGVTEFRRYELPSSLRATGGTADTMKAYEPYGYASLDNAGFGAKKLYDILKRGPADEDAVQEQFAQRFGGGDWTNEMATAAHSLGASPYTMWTMRGVPKAPKEYGQLR